MTEPGRPDRWFGLERRFYAALVRRERKSGRLLELGASGVADRLRGFESVTAEPERIDEFGADAFDVVLALNVLEYAECAEELIAKCAVALRPGGVLIIATPNMASPWAKRKGQRWHGYTNPAYTALHQPASLSMMLGQAGLRLLKAGSDGFWDVPYVPLVPNMVQRVIFGLPGIVQAAAGRAFLPVNMGEGLVLVAEKPG